MSLNPIAFGEHVVEQFQRYLLTYFPIADRRLESQVEGHLLKGPGGQRELIRGPYIHLNRPFDPGPLLTNLLAEPDLGLHHTLPDLFRFHQLYKHQELAAKHILSGKHTVMATATGSGKTEGFLLPILSHCLHLRDKGAPDGVTAVLVYPMNALVNDQLDRLRRMLAGTQITFGRYTGETPSFTPDNVRHLAQSRDYTDEEKRAYREDHADLPRPWEECISRAEIRERKPRLLLTNYRMLEYLLLRDRDLRELLQDAPLKYMVFDEVHTYTGTLGSEVACLIRRLRHVAGKSPDEVTCIGTSATVAPDEDEAESGEALTANFMHRLFGVPREDVEVVSEQYRDFPEPPGEPYAPPRPEDARAMLERVLAASREVHLQEEVGDELPEGLLRVAEELCGHEAPADGSSHDRLHALLAPNEIVMNLSREMTRPLTLEDLHARLQQVGDRKGAGEDDLTCEAMAYLTLGAICQHDDEPLLRPKLHYFVQGYPGLWLSFEPKNPDVTVASEALPTVHFGGQQRETDEALTTRLPLMLCRVCGQHYARAIAEEAWAAEDDNAVMPVRAADPWEHPGEDESICYLSDRLHTQEEDAHAETWFLCRWCGALHRQDSGSCRHEKCERAGPLVPVLVWQDDLSEKTCKACGSMKSISGTRSAEVADINTLSESMLSAMDEPTLRKLLVFSDNRQEAAFQAGWMKERSRRHELRHLLYTIVHGAEEPLTVDALVNRLVDRAEEHRVLDVGNTEDDLKRAQMRARWFLLQEFASMRERRGSLETLGLARIEYEGLTEEADRDFFARWAETFGVGPSDVVNITRTLLDYYRRRGMLSDGLMQHWWAWRDPEVRDGLISVSDWWRPSVLTLHKVEAPVTTKNLLAQSGVTAAGHIVGKSVSDGEDRVADFLAELWEWLQQEPHRFLEDAQITQRSYGRTSTVSVGAHACQVSTGRLRIGPAESRHLCSVCRSVQSVKLPGSPCAEWRCDGTVEEAPSDEDHYAVVRYTQEDFVPLHPVEHSGQVDQEKREFIEEQFRRDDGAVNCIVCTPTLELGVDIGQLEMALMRNVPPTPANYAQRAGRAGRRHRIAVVVDYCGTSPHDRYYFEHPEEMIDGRIRIPAFSMSNEPMLRKHAHSAILTALRQSSDPTVPEVLANALPPYIWRYFAPADADGKQTDGYAQKPPTFPMLREAVDRHADDLRHMLTETFATTWPGGDEAEVVSDERLEQLVTNMPGELEKHVRALFEQVRSYRDRLRELARKVLDEDRDLTPEEERERQRLEFALRTLRRHDQDRYTLSYLSNDGYFPGYALTRDSVVARCLKPYIELQRPEPIALREFTPANWIYAAGDVYAVSRIEWFSLQSGEEVSAGVHRREMIHDQDLDRVIDPALSDREGHTGQAFVSMQLGGVELRQRQQIDDTEDRRHFGAQDITGTVLGPHRGGRLGEVGDVQWRLFRQADLRLVNLGPVGRDREGLQIGFPICRVCGAVRSPYQSEAEIERFEEYHRDSCGRESTEWAALHVDFRSDLLEIGPLVERAEAVNLMEAVLTGAREVLDMGSSELEGFVEERGEGSAWVLLYDPMPGGSGFLQQLQRSWQTVCERAREIMQACDCEQSCYACLLTFWNQRHHALLDRHLAGELVERLGGEMSGSVSIPPNYRERSEDTTVPESGAEEKFAAILGERRFPQPDTQHRVTLGDGTTTVADFAYPDDDVLIYIDGMSEEIHGSAEQRRKDSILRAKLRNAGYKVVEITAASLDDKTAVNQKLDEIAVYLDRDESILKLLKFVILVRTQRG
ncbi:MAG: DEAD/DEAH box helicase [Armatimonadota bacterium]|jgi:ATP-dependent helicase YprA (DUF1998 family)